MQAIGPDGASAREVGRRLSWNGLTGMGMCVALAAFDVTVR